MDFLAQGTRGSVWASKDKKTVTKSAKDAKSASLLFEEARLQAKAHNAGVSTPRILQINKAQKTITMENLQGYKPLLTEVNLESPKQKAAYAKSLVVNLSKAHAADIAHGDLNTNILAKNGQLSIIDWGQAGRVRYKGMADILNAIRIADDLDPSLARTMKQQFKPLQAKFSRREQLTVADFNAFYANVLSRQDHSDEFRTDLKCGKGAISKGEKCRKGVATQVSEFANKAAPIALGLGITAGMIALRRHNRASSAASTQRPAVPKHPPTPSTSKVRHTARTARNRAEQLVERMARRRRQPEPQVNAREQSVNMSTTSPSSRPLIAPAGLRDVVKNTKHNYMLGKNAGGSFVGRSITPEGHTVDFKLGSSGEVEFRVNGGTGRNKDTNFSMKETTGILSRVERMLQASINNLPDNTLIWTNPANNDGLGPKREKLYKRYGFEKSSDDPKDTELFTTVARLKARSRRTDSDRFDLKCGKGAISKGEKCTKGTPTAVDPRALAVVGLTAGALALGAVALRRSRGVAAPPRAASGRGPSGPSHPPSSPPPLGYLHARSPRQSKTQRMRANTAAAIRTAEGRIAQTAREEVRRIPQIGNTMAAAGEATGMAAKTTMRELRLRTEAARRRWEPGYRRGGRLRAPAQLSPGADLAFQSPLTAPRRPAPEAVPVDPRTGQPRRRRAQGFGRSRGDNFIQHYAPVQLQPPTRRDADDGKKYTKVVTNPETGRKNRVRYGAKGYRIAPGTDKGDNYCARSFGDMKSEGYDCSGAERNTPLCLSRAKWKCSGKTSRRGS